MIGQRAEKRRHDVGLDDGRVAASPPWSPAARSALATALRTAAELSASSGGSLARMPFRINTRSPPLPAAATPAANTAPLSLLSASAAPRSSEICPLEISAACSDSCSDSPPETTAGTLAAAPPGRRFWIPPRGRLNLSDLPILSWVLEESSKFEGKLQAATLRFGVHEVKSVRADATGSPLLLYTPVRVRLLQKCCSSLTPPPCAGDE
eukprot:CAMPEP_0177700048 /NCGR_PEP_ID=MMETSP0484_2-20121128/5897_1 /TAXON_ID=354590 /ORGANISM="Rhodomonas lens, Strain RHODO" /LENGTH=208 /DNA_ID=CAMNT_0019211243 /DNA_START=485 /DNA_END=1110 /DNA_ORIENTATION=-